MSTNSSEDNSQTKFTPVEQRDVKCKLCHTVFKFPNIYPKSPHLDGRCPACGERYDPFAETVENMVIGDVDLDRVTYIKPESK